MGIMSLRIRLFCHSIVSDWNHGNAHFLRGIAAELQARGHDVLALEPEASWSLTNLLADAGQGAIEAFYLQFPALKSKTYPDDAPDLDELLDGVDMRLFMNGILLTSSIKSERTAAAMASSGFSFTTPITVR